MRLLGDHHAEKKLKVNMFETTALRKYTAFVCRHDCSGVKYSATVPSDFLLWEWVGASLHLVGSMTSMMKQERKNAAFCSCSSLGTRANYAPRRYKWQKLRSQSLPVFR